METSLEMEGGPEPVHVQALIPQISVEAFHPSILCRLSGLNVNDVDLPFDGPRQEMPRGKLRAVVTPNGLWLAVCGDRPFQFPRDPPAGKAGCRF
jgi:hypothetical protein